MAVKAHGRGSLSDTGCNLKVSRDRRAVSIDYATGWTIRGPNSGTGRRFFFPPRQNICDSDDMGNIPFVTSLLTTNLAGINIRDDDECR
jgi:hypothetical protein